jgi:hypothetical protein
MHEYNDQARLEALEARVGGKARRAEAARPQESEAVREARARAAGGCMILNLDSI